jgi:NAD(P)-dependent dehydrogenase (short-subunit alcohol dehydrogenase family)
MQKNSLNIIITGGNSGIGYETMKDLYLRGHNIIFGSRNESKNQEALTSIL